MVLNRLETKIHTVENYSLKNEGEEMKWEIMGNEVVILLGTGFTLKIYL